MPREALVSMLGPAAGRHLHALARNDDLRPVQTGRRRRSMGAQHALGAGPTSPGDVDTSLVSLVDRVTARMRKAGRVGRTVVLRLRFGDFAEVTRSRTLPQATASTVTVLATARALLQAALPAIDQRGLTLVGVAVGNLADAGTIQACRIVAPSRTNTCSHIGPPVTTPRSRPSGGGIGEEARQPPRRPER